MTESPEQSAFSVITTKCYVKQFRARNLELQERVERLTTKCRMCHIS